MKSFLNIILLIPILLISCGDEKKELPKVTNEQITTEPKEIDACSYLDKTEIEKIFNIKMKDPKKGRNQKGDANKAAFSECSFESEENPKIIVSVYIRFTSIKDENHATIQSVRNSFKQAAIEVTDVEGAGDVAFWGRNQLHVFEGENYYFIVTVIGIKEQEEAIEKAKNVVLYTIKSINSI